MDFLVGIVSHYPGRWALFFAGLLVLFAVTMAHLCATAPLLSLFGRLPSNLFVRFLVMLTLLLVAFWPGVVLPFLIRKLGGQ